MSACHYVRETYGVPACIGRRISMKGRPGIIAEDRGHYIGVNFDDCKPGDVRNAHPTWEMEYLEMGEVRPMTRSQKRYQRWLSVGDMYENFRQFLIDESRREKEIRLFGYELER